MCGIIVVISKSSITTHSVYNIIDILKPRGPDDFTVKKVLGSPCTIMGHTRLRTHNSSSSQPLKNHGWSVVCNGEIYNEQDDCHAIPILLHRYGMCAAGHIDGVFAFVGSHPDFGFVASRDAVGVVPMYVGTCQDSIWFSSMERALNHCDEVTIFPPGYTCYGTIDKPEWICFKKKYKMPKQIADTSCLAGLLTEAVNKRIRTCSTTMGVFLSGGLDSSIVAALAAAYGTIHTFSIGLEGSPDLAAAKDVAAFLGAHHTEVKFTIGEGLAAIPEVIRAVETCDITTVRASVPMYLLSKYVKARGFRVMLSGEGSDEMFAGYAYNRYAPTPEALFNECVEKMNALHAYDCQRANKACAAFGIECRVPFLDRDLVDYAMNKLHPRQKMWDIMEKEVLRGAFRGLLPDHILHRKKAQFSDAVGTQWIDSCRSLFPEHEYYSTLYKEVCPHAACLYELETVACSTKTAAQWVDAQRDPSGIIKV